ncbi:MAG TPA: MaoC/PaaZ C-terminal domain-containing protein [Woeseiaceae bacterium]|nr:MaoC/PaaZ C-terminal domain-containing protein [Woeseiaceae bacterium]
MPIDYDALKAVAIEDQPVRYTDRDALLYAVAIGFGGDPVDRKELAYVYERPSLKTVPTFASVLLPDDFLAECGWDDRHVVHGSQRLELYRPLPPAADLLVNRRVVAAFDRGAGKGSRIIVQSEARMARDDAALFSLGSTLVAKEGGGVGGAFGDAPAPHALPGREPDLSCDLNARADQPLLFRISGGRGAVHVDPEAARAAGFERPILQARCIAGLACRAILETICDYDHTLIAGFDVRYSGVVYPGETLTTDMWQERNVVSFRCFVRSRGTVVLDNGKCTLTG